MLTETKTARNSKTPFMIVEKNQRKGNCWYVSLHWIVKMCCLSAARLTLERTKRTLLRVVVEKRSLFPPSLLSWPTSFQTSNNGKKLGWSGMWEPSPKRDGVSQKDCELTTQEHKFPHDQELLEMGIFLVKSKVDSNGFGSKIQGPPKKTALLNGKIDPSWPIHLRSPLGLASFWPIISPLSGRSAQKRNIKEGYMFISAQKTQKENPPSAKMMLWHWNRKNSNKKHNEFSNSKKTQNPKPRNRKTQREKKRKHAKHLHPRNRNKCPKCEALSLESTL